MYRYLKTLQAGPSAAFYARSALDEWKLFAVLMIPCILIFLNLGRGSIDLADEALTAGRSLSFYHGGDLFALSINGAPTFRKPPLMYLLNALSFSVFGVNEFGLRLPNAVFGFLVFVVIARLANRLFGHPAGLLAVLALAGSPLLINYSREALTDTALVFGLMLALGAIALDLAEGGTGQTKHRAAYGVGLALALVAKGLMALILPAYALTVLLFVDRPLAGKYLLATAFAILPLGFWMGYSWSVYPDFFKVFVLEEAIQRANYQSSFSPQHIRPPYWYLVHLWKWSGCLGLLALSLGTWTLLRGQRYAARAALSPDRLRSWRFVTGFGLVYFLVLSAASHKRDAYILPVLPIFALICLVVFRAALAHYVGAPARKALGLAVGTVILAGLIQTAIHYHPIPDYKPAEKALAKAIAPLLQPGQNVYTDDHFVGLILHFYLDQRIFRVASTDEISRGLVITRTAISGAEKIGPYYFLSRN
jgi:4-amino-4-deoxy-L-arabinose transferase-like glycosyltransferase